MMETLKITFAVIFGALMLQWISALNGQPFFFYDTGAYIRAAETAAVRALGPDFSTDWTNDALQQSERSRSKGEPNDSLQYRQKGVTSVEDGVVLSGRSIYYGALLYLGEISGGLWLSVFGQALVVSYLLFVTSCRCFGLSLCAFLSSATVLALFSTAPFFVGFLMPDILAGVTVLATAIIMNFWTKLRASEKLAIALVLIFTLLSHSTHLLICMSLLGVYMLVSALSGFFRKRSEATAIVVVAVCIAISILGDVAFNVSVKMAIGFAPVRPPFITARLIELGPGYEYLRAHGEENVFTISRFIDRLPLSTDRFLWSRDGVFAPADADTKRALGNEQFMFGLNVLMFDPINVIRSIWRAGVEQFAVFGLSEFQCDDCLPYRLPIRYLNEVKNTLSSRHGELISVFSVVQYAVVVASFLILSAIATAAGFRRKMGRFQPLNRHKYRLSPIWFFAAIIIGVVTNAFICGAFSSLNDRFQARVMWLIPLSAFLALAQGQQSTANADRDGPSLIAPS